ncbi:MAG: quinolinate synthase NadA [Phycisphaerae bacterium]|nr:quinolinate synthase NadA [Phycisphaerae bacterium]
MSQTVIDQIQDLKRKRRAVILAHNYQIGEVQDIADFCGDSLQLSRQAAATDAKVIVFCGVAFMAETAAILSPDKTVLLPDKHAGCPMADMITAEQLAEKKRQHPDALVVAYVNSPAAVKALCDYCCTSGNAVELVESLPKDRPILFVPDRYLGQFVIDKTGRDMILWPGYCPTHVRMDPRQIQGLKEQYPDAEVLCHPECTEPVKALSHQILSTGGMLKWIPQSSARRFIVCTEEGILHTMRKKFPDRQFVTLPNPPICPNMKKITLEKVAWSLEDMQHVITVPENIRIPAKQALDRMLDIMPKGG